MSQLHRQLCLFGFRSCNVTVRRPSVATITFTRVLGNRFVENRKPQGICVWESVCIIIREYYFTIVSV